MPNNARTCACNDAPESPPSQALTEQPASTRPIQRPTRRPDAHKTRAPLARAQGAAAADLDGDGRLELVVATADGSVHALRGHDGTPIPNFPFRTRGRRGGACVLCLLAFWSLEEGAVGGGGLQDRAAIASGAPPRARRSARRRPPPTHPAGSPHYVTAATSPPYITPRIQAPPVVLALHGPPPPGRPPPSHQHVAVMSFDGALYLIDGVTGCAHTVDIGEASYAAVLADDVDGSGTLDLVVSTMNGNVYALGTAAPYHPLKTWLGPVRRSAAPSCFLRAPGRPHETPPRPPRQASPGAPTAQPDTGLARTPPPHTHKTRPQPQSGNGQVARWNYFGAFATAASRAPRDVAGRSLRVRGRLRARAGLSSCGGF